MTHTEVGDIEYDKTSAVHPLTLISEVEKYELLYNKHLSEYTDNTKKEAIWENIHRVLFPNYDNLSEETKNVVKRTVRKRWKSLRDALVKDQRTRLENVHNASKKQSPLVKKMQFLVPFIQTPRHTKSRDSMDNYEDEIHSPDFCRLMNDTTIDLTYQEAGEDSNVQVDDDGMISSDALYPSVRLTTSESENGEVVWKNGFGYSATKQGINYTICEIDEADPEPKPESADCNEDYKVPSESRKRKRNDFDLQSKVVELVERCNTESKDEDRMFLLSLLSDFKRLPVNKKLKIKSAFVMALADALD